MSCNMAARHTHTHTLVQGDCFSKGFRFNAGENVKERGRLFCDYDPKLFMDLKLSESVCCVENNSETRCGRIREYIHRRSSQI